MPTQIQEMIARKHPRAHKSSSYDFVPASLSKTRSVTHTFAWPITRMRPQVPVLVLGRTIETIQVVTFQIRRLLKESMDQS